MNELVRQYIENVKSKKLSTNTLEAYIRDISQFENFLSERKEDIFTADKLTVMAYIQNLGKLGRADSSIARNLISVRNFYKFLINTGKIKEAPVFQYEIPKYERHIPDVLTEEEVEKLLSTPDLSTDKGIRDRAMLELMYATGIKITEMLDLMLGDVNTKLKYIKCKGMKGKERIIPLGNFAVEYIERYLQCRHRLNVRELDLLFFNTAGDKMTRQGFWKVVKYYAKKSNINKDINLYTLRHSFAVHLLQNGADMKSVQELLGHTDLNTTQIYLNLTNKNKLAEVYKNAHPRA